MWRFKARSLLLLRSHYFHSHFHPLAPAKTPTLIGAPRLLNNHRLYSTNPNSAFDSDELKVDSSMDAANSGWNFNETEPSNFGFDVDERADLNGKSNPNSASSSDIDKLKMDSSIDTTNSGWNSNASVPFDSGFGVDGTADLNAESNLNLDESGQASAAGFGAAENFDSNDASGWNFAQPETVFEDGAVNEVAEVDLEKIEYVVLILKNGSEEPIEARLDNLELNLSEEFVMKVLESSDTAGINLIEFYRWVLKKDESLKTIRDLEMILNSVKSLSPFSKKDAYALWDLIKDLGQHAGFLQTELLNEMIDMFYKLGKAKAGLEVYEKFSDFGCDRDMNSYYYTILALGKRSMFDKAWSVCEEMINSGSLPEEEKIGEIVTFFVKGWKAKEAHLLYMAAKEKNLVLPRSSLDALICGLTQHDECVPLALELTEDYPNVSYKDAHRAFGLVIKGLCKIKKHGEAKSLLLKMVESGPSPKNASFNNVINAFSKIGEVEEAVSLMKLMESRGLKPDVYTYTVVMSGYAKGGLMEEAYKIYCEAKKKHGKLSPATYHVLTRGYCKMEEYEKAIGILKDMKEHGVQPNADEYNKMIETLCLRALDWRTAEKLLEEMKESGLYLKAVTHSLVSAVRELEEDRKLLEEDTKLDVASMKV